MESPVRVKHDAYMHHGQSRESHKTKKNENRGIINFAEIGVSYNIHSF